MKYSQRLLCMAQEISVDDQVIDIGSEHGYLPIILWEKYPGIKVIVSDISPGSLKKARENIGSYLTEDQEKQWASFRLGSGLSVVSPGEATVAVVAGMGGLLISQILEESEGIARNLEKLILQPRNGQGKLRYWLLENGYQIVKERLAKEGKFICEILVVRSTSTAPISLEWSLGKEMEFEVPQHLLEVPDRELVAPFLRGKLEQEQNIRNALACSNSPDLVKAAVTDNRISYLEALIQRWEEDQNEHMEAGINGSSQ